MSARIKGATLLNTTKVVKELVGQSEFVALLALCPIETQEQLRRTLMAVEWVPLDLWAPFLDALLVQVAGRDEAKFRRILRLAYKRDFTSIYRAYVQGITLVSLLAKLGGLWSVYFDCGSLVAGPIRQEGGQQHITIQLQGLETKATVYYLAIHAYIEQLLMLAGAENLTMQRSGEARHGNHLGCQYLVSCTCK